MESFTPLSSLVGGVLIGLSATMMLALHGRITGISGITFAALEPSTKSDERTWRFAFLLGLLGAGAVLMHFMPGQFQVDLERSLAATALAGLLVGWGTRLGGGCTSGHGVCGISRLSPRSIVATVTFMATGALTVLAVNALGGYL